MWCKIFGAIPTLMVLPYRLIQLYVVFCVNETQMPFLLLSYSDHDDSMNVFIVNKI